MAMNASLVVIVTFFYLSQAFKNRCITPAKFNIQLHCKKVDNSYNIDVSNRNFDDLSKVYDDGIKVSNVKIADINGLRGIISSSEGGINESNNKVPLVSVVATMALEVTNSRPPTPYPELVSQSLWESSKWDHRLAFKLLHDLHAAQVESSGNNKNSFWLKQLPYSFSTPFHWSDSELDELQYNSLKARVISQRLMWSALYTTWKADCKNASYLKAITLSKFVYALECINSRAFSGVYEGSSATQRQALLLFTGLLTLVWPLAGFGTPEQALSAAVAVGISILLRDVFFSKVSGLKRYVVCPYIDMFNHKSTANSDVSYNYFSNTFEVFTKDNYKKGDQVFISYGKQSNDRLLQFYGFVEASTEDDKNPYDLYDFGSSILELVLRFGDDITTDKDTPVPFPVQSNPKMRLEMTASALRNTAISNENMSDKMLSVSDSSKNTELTCRYFRTKPQTAIPSSGGSDLDTVSSILDSKRSGIASYFDDISVRCLRAIYCSEKEWQMLIGPSGSLDSLERLGQIFCGETEASVARSLKCLCRYELASKVTSIDEDIRLLEAAKACTTSGEGSSLKGFAVKEMALNDKGVDPAGMYVSAGVTAIAFRIEKKKLLLEALSL